MHKMYKFYITIIMFFLYIPIFYLIFYSFNEAGNMIEFSGFTLDWYSELFANSDLLIIILNTLIVALISSFVASIIGFFGAITIYNFKGKRISFILSSINSIFLISPDVIIGISLLSLFSIASIPLGFETVVLSHIAFSIPVTTIMILAKLEGISFSVINAAYDLGATNKEVVTKVILPLVKPGIIAGFITAFTYSIDDFAVTYLVTGNGFSTLGIDIYSSARQGISMEINALSTIIFLLTVIVAIFYYIYERKRRVDSV